jgi:hypothetical protein
LSPFRLPDTTENRIAFLRSFAAGGVSRIHDRSVGTLVKAMIDEGLITSVAHYKAAADYRISAKGLAMLARLGLTEGTR